MRMVRLAMLLAFLAAPALAQDEQREISEGQARPLITQDIELVKPGTIRVQAGFSFLQDQDFSLSGLNGDLTKVGEIGIHIGVSPNVEVQVEGTIQQFLSIEEQFQPSLVPLDLGTNAVDTQDFADLTIATKIKITEEKGRWPAFGVRFGFESPSTNESKGIGTNTTNVFAQIIAAKTVGRARIFANLGIGVLQAPTKKFAQNDVLMYGLGFRAGVTDRVRIVGEVNGRFSTRDAFPGTEDRSEARLGLQVDAVGLRWDAAGTFGLTRWSPSTGIVFGFTKDIEGAFDPVIK